MQIIAVTKLKMFNFCNKLQAKKTTNISNYEFITFYGLFIEVLNFFKMVELF